MGVAKPSELVAIPAGEHVPTADQRIVLHANWQRYEVELAFRGEGRHPRMAYLDGALELMSPSKDHERIGFLLSRLLEVYAEEHDIDFMGYGSWTQKSALKDAGAEPDHCYIVGKDQSKPRPDVAIEVVWTSGGVDKLEIYKRLGIQEVWFWIANALTIYALVGGEYQGRRTSQFFPGLDLELLCSFLDRESFAEAKREYLAALRR